MKHSYFVTPEWLAANLDNQNIRVVDATIFFDLDEEELLKSGKKQYQTHHIPGAVEANLFELSNPQAKLPFTIAKHEDFIKALEDLGISNHTHVVIYDSGPQVGVDFSASIWAARLAWQMLWAGLENVSILEGGFDRWLAENRPISKEIPKFSPGKLNVIERSEYLASKQDVIRAMDNESIVIIDALSPEQYRGEIAPYGLEKAGHIPSAINVFYGLMADSATGELKSRNDLAQLFLEIDALSPEKEIINYCGFGVGAAWNFIILKHLGKQKVSVYDGSMDEWTIDANLPIEK